MKNPSKELREYLGPDFTAHMDQLRQERDLIAEDVYTELKMMNKNELETFKEELTEVKDLNHFEDEEEDEICQLCGAIRLLPRCRKQRGQRSSVLLENLHSGVGI